MSTRTRIVMTYNGMFHVAGGAAIRELLHRVYPNAINSKHKLDALVGKSKQDKLKEMAEKLPPGFALILIQEPRDTRKNRSVYQQYKGNKIVQQQGGIRLV